MCRSKVRQVRTWRDLIDGIHPRAFTGRCLQNGAGVATGSHGGIGLCVLVDDHILQEVDLSRKLDDLRSLMLLLLKLLLLNMHHGLRVSAPTLRRCQSLNTLVQGLGILHLLLQLRLQSL
jgi:hypothetical protein